MGARRKLLSARHRPPSSAGGSGLSADVAIVGAGPAGTAAAICCAGAGLDVAIFERQPFPRERPGETLHPGVQVLFDRLDVVGPVLGGGFLRHEGIRVSWDGPPCFVPYGADSSGVWRGFQIPRAALDAILLRRAIDLGASLCQPCRAVRPLVERGRVCGVETSQGHVRARLVVDAAGSQHWFARQRGIELVRRSPRLIARYGYCAGPKDGSRGNGSLDRLEADPYRACQSEGSVRGGFQVPAPVLAAAEDGWTWTAQIGPALHAWTRLYLRAGRADPKQVAHRLHGLRPVGQVRGADVSWRALTLPAGPGYVAAGDAAAVLDPSSSHGVLKALLSGAAVAELALESLRTPAHESRAAERYNKWVGVLFDTEVKELRRLYARLPRPPTWVLGSQPTLAFMKGQEDPASTADLH